MTDATIDVEPGPTTPSISPWPARSTWTTPPRPSTGSSTRSATKSLPSPSTCSGLDYIDSAGLRVLFTLGTRLETLQIALQLLVPSESPIRRVIDLAGVAAAVPVLSS